LGNSFLDEDTASALLVSFIWSWDKDPQVSTEEAWKALTAETKGRATNFIMQYGV
jgi:hypothetical protein